jgi:hypothetical protein
MPALGIVSSLPSELEPLPSPETKPEAKAIPALPSISEILEMLDPKLKAPHC